MIMIKGGVTKQRTMTPLMLRLTTLWQARSAACFGGYEKPLTDKEFGQFKYLRKCLGDETLNVAEYALKNWSRFAISAGVGAGVAFPTEPHIGFFVKHHAVAVNMLRKSMAPPPPPKPTPLPRLSLPQKPIEVAYKPTHERKSMK